MPHERSWPALLRRGLTPGSAARDWRRRARRRSAIGPCRAPDLQPSGASRDACRPSGRRTDVALPTLPGQQHDVRRLRRELLRPHSGPPLRSRCGRRPPPYVAAPLADGPPIGPRASARPDGGGRAPPVTQRRVVPHRPGAPANSFGDRRLRVRRTRVRLHARRRPVVPHGAGPGEEGRPSPPGARCLALSAHRGRRARVRVRMPLGASRSNGLRPNPRLGSVVLCDDHVVVREGLRRVIDGAR